MSVQIHRLSVATSGDNTILSLPTDWKPDGTRTAIVLCGGFGDLYTSAFNSAACQPIIARLNTAGYPVVISDLGGTASSGLWGNSDVQTRIGALRTYMQSAAVGARTGPIFGVGFSMGALTLLAYAANNASNVAGLVLGAPITDVQVVKDNGAYTAALDAAYSGGWSEATYGSTTNPKTMARGGRYVNTPIKAYYAPDDTLVTPATVTAFQAIVGPSMTATATGNVGHSWQQLNTASRLEEIAAFFTGLSL